MNYIIDVLRITYPEYGMTQVRNLVSQKDFELYYKPIKDQIYELEVEKSNLNKKKYRDKINNIDKEINILKSKLKAEFGDFITTESPIYKSLENNGIIILPEHQGGECKVIIESIK